MAKQKNTAPVVEQKEKVEVAATATETTQEVVTAKVPETTTETTETVVTEVDAPETTTETTETVETVVEVPETTTETTETVVTVVEAPETTTEDNAKPDVVDFSAEAEKLMKAQYIKEIWRCPVKGYWFTKSDLASDHGKKVGKKPEHYTL